jgi:hypothetical protein
MASEREAVCLWRSAEQIVRVHMNTSNADHRFTVAWTRMWQRAHCFHVIYGVASTAGPQTAYNGGVTAVFLSRYRQMLI